MSITGMSGKRGVPDQEEHACRAKGHCLSMYAFPNTVGSCWADSIMCCLLYPAHIRAWWTRHFLPALPLISWDGDHAIEQKAIRKLLHDFPKYTRVFECHDARTDFLEDNAESCPSSPTIELINTLSLARGARGTLFAHKGADPTIAINAIIENCERLCLMHNRQCKQNDIDNTFVTPPLFRSHGLFYGNINPSFVAFQNNVPGSELIDFIPIFYRCTKSEFATIPSMEGIHDDKKQYQYMQLVSITCNTGAHAVAIVACNEMPGRWIMNHAQGHAKRTDSSLAFTMDTLNPFLANESNAFELAYRPPYSKEDSPYTPSVTEINCAFLPSVGFYKPVTDINTLILISALWSKHRAGYHEAGTDVDKQALRVLQILHENDIRSAHLLKEKGIAALVQNNMVLSPDQESYIKRMTEKYAGRTVRAKR
jgi:hypothetical protein